jgi:DNA-binding IscR family transcriptional regulator
MGDWTFFSNYGHVLVCLARNREARLRDVAAQVGITERAVQKIVRDMQDAGFLTVTKQGRCNRYRINRRKSLRHGLESHCSVGKLLRLVDGTTPSRAPGEAAEEAAPESEPGPSAGIQAATSAAQPTEEEPAARKPAEKKPAKDEGSDKKAKEGIDVRQQGSLF